MRDVAEIVVATVTARVTRGMDERECKQRNALSKTRPGFVLRPGDVGTVVETFGSNEAFLVEFNKGGKSSANSCDWMGVLYPAEIEVESAAGQAAR